MFSALKYGSEDVYIVGKSVKCDLPPNWASLMSVAGQLLYSIQRCRPVSPNSPPHEKIAYKNGSAV